MEEQKQKELEREFLKKIDSLKMTVEEFDDFCSKKPHIIRSIRGHAFETRFDNLMARSGIECIKVGGDEIVDRKLNGHTLQLKTPYWNGTIENEIVQYKMHKTHGREKYPEALYKRDEFADFFIGMHPKGGVIICPAKNLPTRADLNPRSKWGEYIADPMPFGWNTEWYDRYDLIGIDYSKLCFDGATSHLLLPRIDNITGYNDFEIMSAILSNENFRVWQQLIIGSVREFHFEKFMKKMGIPISEVNELDARSRVKVDYTYIHNETKRLIRIQVKGLTKNLCRTNFLVCETQCSHSRIPIRLYKRNDFEVLVVVIDPYTIPKMIAERMGIKEDEYNFLFVRMVDLPRHPRSDEWGEEYIKSTYQFDIRSSKLNSLDVLLQYTGIPTTIQSTL